MMRALMIAIVLLLALNFLGVLGFVGWLAATDRLSSARAADAYAIFELTSAEQKQRDAEREAETQREREAMQQLAWLESVSDGPRTMQDRLAADRQADELARHRLDQLQSQTDILRRQIELSKRVMAQQRVELDRDRAAFEAFVAEHTRKAKDEEFQRAVQMYEQIRPVQAKQMFQELMGQGRMEDVVDYLAAMQLRRASKVLEQFREPAEIVQVTELIERLRQRGVYPDGPMSHNEMVKQEGDAR